MCPEIFPKMGIDGDIGLAQMGSRDLILQGAPSSNHPVMSLNKPSSGAIRKTPRISAEVGVADLVGPIVPAQLRRSGF